MTPLSEWRWWPLATVFATPILALVGGWYGARLALGRFKAERTWDARVDWHRKAMQAVRHHQRLSKELKYDEPFRPRGWVDSQYVVRGYAAEAPAFMTATGSHRVRLAMLLFNNAVDGTTDHLLGRPGAPSNVLECITAEDAQLRELEAAFLEGLTRLMPPEQDWLRWWHFRRRFSQRWRDQRVQRMVLKAGSGPPSPKPEIGGEAGD